jgi:hypothetical protein
MDGPLRALAELGIGGLRCHHGASNWAYRQHGFVFSQEINVLDLSTI